MRRAMMVMVSLVLLLNWGGSATGAILPDITNWGGYLPPLPDPE